MSSTIPGRYSPPAPDSCATSWRTLARSIGHRNSGSDRSVRPTGFPRDLISNLLVTLVEYFVTKPGWVRLISPCKATRKRQREEQSMRMGVLSASFLRFLALGLMLSPALTASSMVGRAGEAGDDLASQVTIRRDTFGVPHVLAATEEAAAYGLGFVNAEDHVMVLGRLFQKARGEEAAHFGPKFAKDDMIVKQLHIYEGAQTGFAKLAPWMQRILDGYAAGYNRYVSRHRAELPEWVTPI